MKVLKTAAAGQVGGAIRGSPVRSVWKTELWVRCGKHRPAGCTRRRRYCSRASERRRSACRGRCAKRVFLYYDRVEGPDGTVGESFANGPGYAETEFQPCPDKPRTVWGGGLRIKGTAPVRLLVQLEGGGEAISLRLGRPRIHEPNS